MATFHLETEPVVVSVDLSDDHLIARRWIEDRRSSDEG